MKVPVQIEGFEDQKVEVEVPGILGAAKLYINGEEASRGGKPNEIIIQKSNGDQVVGTWKSQALGFDAPLLVVDGKATRLVEPLKWYEWVWSGLPLVFIIIGGALGALLGTIAFFINMKIIRSSMKGFLKYFLTGVVTVLTTIVFFVLGILINLLIGRGGA